MAKLPQSNGGSGLQIRELAPVGQHVAVCLRVNDLFNVERPAFNNPNEKEFKDVTRFVFGVKDQTGKLFLVQTYEFTISGAPGSNLCKFLKGWLGQDPRIGWDYAEMQGKGAMLTIQHQASRKNPGESYANISGIAPVHPQLAHMVPNANEFEPMLRALEAQSQQGANPAPANPAPMPRGSLPPPPSPVLPPPPAPARPKSPDGKWEWDGAQWVPAQTAFAPPPPPTGYAPTAPAAQDGLDEDVPF